MVTSRPRTAAPDEVIPVMGVGTVVEVHCRFDQRWTTGFTVVEVADDGYRLRRTSDGAVLPAWFPREQVRPWRRDL
ncbi:MAG: hypothetical protein JST64_13055 [Actinobacteria bacterium]|nr:hypothetical protein [Actinomycetota bacterium]